jgi:hypothetical protein
MSKPVNSDEIGAIVQEVARAWAAQWTPARLFIGRAELGPSGARAVVTVALGGPARERVSRLVIDLAERCVCSVAPVAPLCPWKGDVVTPALLAWTERCWPEVERVATARGVRVAACTAMAIRGRWWLLGPRTLWLCVEDVSRPLIAHRHAVLRCNEDGRLLSDARGLWAGMKGPRGGERE